MAVVRSRVLPTIEQHGPIQAWIIDDTSFPKKGTQSVGVARQCCGQLGKQDNGQVAVSLSVANQHASLPVADRLSLPQAWTEDAARRGKAGVPDDLRFTTQPQMALEQIRNAQADGIPPGTVLADAGYGADTDFRDGITALGLADVVGIQSSASLGPPGQAPLPAKPWSGRGRPPTRVGRSAEHKPVSAQTLAAGLPRDAWRRVTGRQGTNAPLTSRFAAVRLRPAHRDDTAATPRPEEWCLIEGPVGEAEPAQFWLSTLPANTRRIRLVRQAMLRWRIERNDQELKQEIGLGPYEGRGWRGFHHHATLCIAAYGVLIAERATIPPSAEPDAPRIQAPDIPRPSRPRGAADPA
jgi:SRSO17 transposase